jgi:Arc/MetJ family transcription regulator
MARHVRAPYSVGAPKSASFDVILIIPAPRSNVMRTTVNLDESLLEQAQHLSGLTDRNALIREGLKALIQRESARRLARLGGSEPQLAPIPRRQSGAS